MTVGTGPAANVWFPRIVCLFETFSLSDIYFVKCSNELERKTIDQCVRRLRQEAMSWECLAWMKPTEIRSSGNTEIINFAGSLNITFFLQVSKGQQN